MNHAVSAIVQTLARDALQATWDHIGETNSDASPFLSEYTGEGDERKMSLRPVTSAEVFGENFNGLLCDVLWLHSTTHKMQHRAQGAWEGACYMRARVVSYTTIGRAPTVKRKG